jgi:hypothetical protein
MHVPLRRFEILMAGQFLDGPRRSADTIATWRCGVLSW